MSNPYVKSKFITVQVKFANGGSISAGIDLFRDYGNLNLSEALDLHFDRGAAEIILTAKWSIQ